MSDYCLCAIFLDRVSAQELSTSSRLRKFCFDAFSSTVVLFGIFCLHRILFKTKI